MLKQFIYTFFYLLISLLFCDVYAQTSELTSHVHPIYLDQGADTDYSYQVIFDDDGYLWAGTDNSLKRYDGYKVTNFIHDPTDPNSISSNSIEALLYDDGVLWAGGTSLNKYHPETQNFTNYDVSGSAIIWSLYKDNKNIMWVGGEGFGLRGFDLQKNKIVHEFLLNEDERFIYEIVPIPNTNKFWVSTSKGLALFDTVNFDIEYYFEIKKSETNIQVIEDFLVDHHGYIWMVSRNGVIKLNPLDKSIKHYRHNPADPYSISSNTLWSIYQDNKKRIWIGSDKKGINLYDEKLDGFQHISAVLNVQDSFKFPSVAINDIFQDTNNSLWFATGQGILRVSMHLDRFQHLKNISGDLNSLNFNNVLDLHQDKKGDIWIATDGGGLDKYQPEIEKFTHYMHVPEDSSSLSSDSVIAIDEDKQGYLWLGTYAGGLNRFNPQTGVFKRFTHDPEKPTNKTIADDNIFRVHVAKDQKVWLSIWRTGLQIYDPMQDEFTSYFPVGEGKESGIVNFNITDIEPDGKGNYWISGYEGLEYFDTETRSFTKIYLPELERIFDVFVDKDIIWLATADGFVKYDHNAGTHQIFTTLNGLADNFVTTIEKDNQGLFWLGTKMGINSFDPYTQEVKNFTKSEGLTSNLFNRFSHLHTREGKMYFGGPQGINVFDPQNMPRNEMIPNVVLTDFYIHHKTDSLTDNSVLNKHIGLTEDVELTYLQNDLIIEFAALGFISPDKNAYKYKLVGLENEWNEVDALGRHVRYTNLSPGTYIFQVMASNSEGVWNPKPRELNITIFPPWWNTWWAYVIFILAFIGIIYLYIYRSTLKNKKMALKLERQVKDRTLELKASHDELSSSLENLKTTQDQLVQSEKMASLGALVAGVAHEVNTPLGICLTANTHLDYIIRKLVNKIEENSLTKNDFVKYKDEIIQSVELSLSNIGRAAELINSFKQIAVEQTSELPDTFLLKNKLQDCINTMTPKLSRRNISVELICPDGLKVSSYPGLLSQIIINFIMNSITHGFDIDDIGSITILVKKTTRQTYLINYQDTGKGIDKKNISMVFEPFFTTNRKEGNTGLGMHIVYNLVTQKLNGKIEIIPKNSGVEFELELPCEIEIKE